MEEVLRNVLDGDYDSDDDFGGYFDKEPAEEVRETVTLTEKAKTVKVRAVALLGSRSTGVRRAAPPTCPTKARLTSSSSL